MRRFLILSLLFMLITPIVFAQEATSGDPLQPLWDAINELRNVVHNMRQGVAALRNEFNAHVDTFSQFQIDVNNEISNLYFADDALLNGLNATNVAVQENTDSINVHSQELIDLNQTVDALIQTDFSLQTQINDNNTTFNNYTAQTDAHLQTLDMTDANLQGQINGLSVDPLSRTKVYEVINTNPNENAAYCNDESDILLFGYCLGSPLGGMPFQNNYLYESFLDFDFTANPTWINLINGFYVSQIGSSVPGKLVCYGPGICEIGTVTNFSSNGLVMEAQIYGNQIGDVHYIGITDNYGALGLSNENGYYLSATQNGINSMLALYRLDNGTITPVTQALNIPMSVQNEYMIKAERNSNGFWQMYFNNQAVGTQVFDLIHRSFLNTHIKYHGNGGDAGRFDDIRVSDLNQTSSNSAILNMQNQSLAMGIHCQANGTARALCLQID